MSFDAGVYVTLALAGVAFIVWLVRLEGRLNGKADASQVQAAVAAGDAVKASVDNAKKEISTLQLAATTSATSGEETKIEVVRLQEQIKHLTNLIERWLQPALPSPAPRRRNSGEN